MTTADKASLKKFKAPANIRLDFGLIFTIAILAALLTFVYYLPARQWVENMSGVTFSADYMRGAMVGFLLAIGLLILIPNQISHLVVDQFHIGWVAIVAGLWLIFGESLLPIMANMTQWQWIALVLGIVLAGAGYAYYKLQKTAGKSGGTS